LPQAGQRLKRRCLRIILSFCYITPRSVRRHETFSTNAGWCTDPGAEPAATETESAGDNKCNISVLNRSWQRQIHVKLPLHYRLICSSEMQESASVHISGQVVCASVRANELIQGHTGIKRKQKRGCNFSTLVIQCVSGFILGITYSRWLHGSFA
jgi:hypothetical protein